MITDSIYHDRPVSGSDLLPWSEVPAVAAVYDRRNDSLLRSVGGHKPPLQETANQSGNGNRSESHPKFPA
jgi:hypothetical protein